MPRGRENTEKGGTIKNEKRGKKNKKDEEEEVKDGKRRMGNGQTKRKY